MLTCIVEIAMLVMGIMALVKGEVKFSKRKVVRGAAARILGVILLLPFPIAFMVGIALAATAAANGQPAPDMMTAVIAEVIVLGVIGVVAVAFAMATAQDPSKLPPKPGANTSEPNFNFPPPDPNNPYASPYASGQKPPPGPTSDGDDIRHP